ncbi:hypothetical protein L6452_08777 [Arctium lappa]|uniref:Uncharacterized protein n=1 Tax=Arctium lappa TaxID=4217 RepID=A0ACB9DIF9_ARCLA|nr:hypothetical protein L6452_08777 [Arctium lappa]
MAPSLFSEQGERADGKAVNNVIEDTKVKGVAALKQKHAAMAKNGVVAASKKDESNDDTDSKCETCILFMLSVSNSAYLRKVQVCTSIQFARVQNLRIKAQCADQNGLKQKYTECSAITKILSAAIEQTVSKRCCRFWDSRDKLRSRNPIQQKSRTTTATAKELDQSLKVYLKERAFNDLLRNLLLLDRG